MGCWAGWRRPVRLSVAGNRSEWQRRAARHEEEARGVGFGRGHEGEGDTEIDDYGGRRVEEGFVGPHDETI